MSEETSVDEYEISDVCVEKYSKSELLYGPNFERRREIIWPEWSDSDLNAEKWDVQKSSVKPKLKHSTKGGSSTISTAGPMTINEFGIFDDPYPVALPWSLVRQCKQWIRPPDLISALKPVEEPPEIIPESKPGSKAGSKPASRQGGKHDTKQETKQVIFTMGPGLYPNLKIPNLHILHSEFIRNFISAVNTLLYIGITHPFTTEWETSVYTSNTSGTPWKPWHHVYSMCKAGKDQHHVPQVNHIGKYVVRLFWLGCWRKITVDDKYPVDADTHSLLPILFGNEGKEFQLWPLLLIKALLKIACLTWTEEEELCDFDIITCLTGWQCQKLPTKNLDVLDMWEICAKYTDSYTWNDVEMSAKIYAEANPPEKSAKSSKKGSKKSKKSDTTTQKSASSSKSTKSGKTVQKLPSLYHLVLSCEDLRDKDETEIHDITPCWPHDFLIEQTRDIPLLKKYPEPPKEYEKWKDFRWIDWAVERGLWEREVTRQNVKCMNVVSTFRRTTETKFLFQAPTEYEQQIQMSVNIVLEVIEGRVKEKKKKGKKGKDKDKKKKDKSSEKKSDKKSEKSSGKKSDKKSDKKSGKKSRTGTPTKQKKLPPEPEYTNVWCKFEEIFPHLKELIIYYKPSSFKTSFIITNIPYQDTIKNTKKTTKKEKDDKKPKTPQLQMEKTVKYINYKPTPLKSRNEPLYLFTDTIDYKLTLVSLAHVGNDFPIPEYRKAPQEKKTPRCIPNKRICEEHECIEECLCQPSEETFHEIPEFFDSRISTNLVFETFEWKNRTVGNISTMLRTYGTITNLIELSNGRHVQKLFLNVDGPYVITVLCDSNMTIGSLEEILECMTHESELLTKQVYDFCAGFGFVIRYFGQPEFHEYLLEFYKHYKPNVVLEKASILNIHEAFKEELIKVLETYLPTTSFYDASLAFKVLFLDPSFRLKYDVPIFISIKKIEECPCFDDKEILRHRAAIKIQAFFKKIYVEKLKAMQSRIHKKHDKIFGTLKEIYNSIFSSKGRNLTCYDMFRFLMWNPKMKEIAQYYPYYRDLSLVIQIESLSGNIKLAKSDYWVPITRQTFYINRPCSVHIWAYLFCTLPVYMLRIFDNDTEEEVLKYSINALVTQYHVNKKGYTVVVYGWLEDDTIDSLKWRLCIIIDKLSNEIPISLNETLHKTTELTGNYIPTSTFRICRFKVRVVDASLVSFQLRVSSDNVKIKFECLNKDGEVIYESIGLTHIIVPILFLDSEDFSELTGSMGMNQSNETEPSNSKTESIPTWGSVKTGGSIPMSVSMIPTSGSIPTYSSGYVVSNQDEICPATSCQYLSDKASQFFGDLLELPSTTTIKTKREIEEFEINGRCTEYVVQAFVIDDSWPLTADEWTVVDRLKTLNNIEGELFHDNSSKSTIESLNKGSYKSFTRKSQTKKLKQKGLSTEKVAETDKPLWTLITVFDKDKNAWITTDNSEIEDLKEFKRQLFSENPKRFLDAKQLRQDYLDSNYISWPPGETEKLLFRESNSQCDHHSSIESFRIQIPSSLHSDRHPYCPKCQKEKLDKGPVFYMSPHSINTIMPPPEIDKYNKYLLRLGKIQNPVDELQFRTEVKEEIDQFDNYRNDYSLKMLSYYEDQEQRFKFLETWYTDIREKSKKMMTHNALDIECIRTELWPIPKKDKKKGKSSKATSAKSSDKSSKKSSKK